MFLEERGLESDIELKEILYSNKTETFKLKDGIDFGKKSYKGSFKKKDPFHLFAKGKKENLDQYFLFLGRKPDFFKIFLLPFLKGIFLGKAVL